METLLNGIATLIESVTIPRAMANHIADSQSNDLGFKSMDDMIIALSGDKNAHPEIDCFLRMQAYNRLDIVSQLIVYHVLAGFDNSVEPDQTALTDHFKYILAQINAAADAIEVYEERRSE